MNGTDPSSLWRPGAMTERERTKLLFGPYQVPRLRRGDRATCLYRDTDVVLVGMSNGRINWPRCSALGQRGGSGLLVDEELARAVRTESAAAVCCWWGVSQNTVKRWRRALGVTRTNNPGTRRLIRSVVSATLKAMYGPEPAPGARVGPDGPKPRPRAVWSKEELALLGVVSDPEVSKRTGRSLAAVHVRRRNLGLPAVGEGPKGPRRLDWTAAEDRVVRTRTVAEAVQRLNRSRGAIHKRREALGVAEKREDPWSAKELALLGVVTDAEVARRTGRTLAAVKKKRGTELGLPAVVEGPKGLRQLDWTAEEDQVVRTRTVAEAARRLNRSRDAIYLRRSRLGVTKSR
jgi:hypothetical protein